MAIHAFTAGTIKRKEPQLTKMVFITPRTGIRHVATTTLPTPLLLWPPPVLVISILRP